MSLSPLRQDSAECPQCGSHFAQKSELRAHQMARKCGVRESLRTKIRAELSSNGSECGVAVSPRTKSRAELLSNGKQLALPPCGWRFRLGSEPGDGDLSPCSPRFFRLAPLRCVPIFLGYVAYFILLGTGLFLRYWQYGSIDATTATQLLINSNWFPLPWDIGIPRHWNPESTHWDIGTSGHWNPKCTGRRKGTDPRTGSGQKPEERH